MNTKILIGLGALAVLVATFFIDSRLTPIVGAAALLAAVGYSWASNRKAGEESFRKAERATRVQKRTHTGPRS